MVWFLGFHFPPVRSPYGADQAAVEAARKAASGHQTDEHWLCQLGGTERDADFHLLWQHCMRSQILPENLKRLRRRDVEYVAAHSGDVVYLVRDPADKDRIDRVSGRNLKLQENATRAKFELDRRDRRNAAVAATLIAAFIGTAAGGVLDDIWRAIFG